ncbi:uncharacterized protein LOC108140882 [Drosophila elegans]|uniref:uncharacterized protein LOC108140882 n=1 Tax=Drosophila elegans TaxID=30023 RepID=UPI0007E5F021|nr:uncharacterized protein LOC108140882 [Drosophila elegans]
MAMSTFLGGTRRNPPDRSKIIKAKKPEGKRVTGSSGGEGSGGSGVGAVGGANGSTSAAKRNCGPLSGARAPKRTTAVPTELSGVLPKRATGGGGGPTRTLQTTATSTMRRRQAPLASVPVRIPAPRQINEVKWIMMPSPTFVPCSETSSSEDNSLEQAKINEQDVDVDVDVNVDVDLERSSSSGRLEKVHQLEDLCQVTPAKTKVRCSRIFCVPSQRIMHEEELLQAQLRQMHPRRTKTSNWPSSRLPPQLISSDSRNPPTLSRVPSQEDLLDASKAEALIQPDAIEATGMISSAPSPNGSPSRSLSRLQSPRMSTSHTRSPGSSSHPATNPSTQSSSLSSNSSMQEVQSVIQQGNKAIKLTSTVIKIMPTKVKQEIPKEKKKLPKPPQVKKGQAVTGQSVIASPKFTPRVQVISPISQSVNYVVNQLTAQLKEAATMPSKDRDKSSKGDAHQVWPSKVPSSRPSIYLLMNQPKDQSAESANKVQSKDGWLIQPMEPPKKPSTSLHRDQPRSQAGKQQTNPSAQPRHNLSRYMNDPRNMEGNQSQNQSTSPQSPGLSSLNPSTNPYIPRASKAKRAPPATFGQSVSVNRTSRPATSIARPYVAPPPLPPPPVAQPTDAPTTGGRIVRKEQHKVPRTMEDGIDTSYQYFVSIPLKRGKKPQVVRYLYRPMVRQLNAPTTTSSMRRRSLRRAKRKREAAGGDGEQTAADGKAPEMDPTLGALGGMPLPLEDPPKAKETLVIDPVAALNAPYEVPPLKLEARFKPMMERLAEMPYPEDQPHHHRRRRRRRRSNRLARAAGGDEQLAPTEHHLATGGGGDAINAMNAMRSTGQESSVWKPSCRRPALVNYRPEANRLSTATGAPISYHPPVQFMEAGEDGFMLPGEPMIQAITYDDIEQQEKQEQPEHQLEQIDQLLLDLSPGKRQQGATVVAKSVSFHPGEVTVSEAPTRRSSSISIGSTSSSCCDGSKSKGRRATRKSKVTSMGKVKSRR